MTPTEWLALSPRERDARRRPHRLAMWDDDVDYCLDCGITTDDHAALEASCPGNHDAALKALGEIE